MVGSIRLRAAFLAAVVAVIVPSPRVCAADEPLKSYKAAAIVYDPAWGDLDGNIARISTAVDEAGAQGVKLAVLPEQATIGYIFDRFAIVRSEEHTSELQSLRHLVCRLLLEKKKKK